MIGLATNILSLARRGCQVPTCFSFLTPDATPVRIKTAAAISIRRSTFSGCGLRVEYPTAGEPGGEIAPEASEPIEHGGRGDGTGSPFVYGFLSGELQRRAQKENGEST